MTGDDEMAAAQGLVELGQDVQGAAEAEANLACRTLAVEYASPLPSPPCAVIVANWLRSPRR